ncbi:hypothetical protein BDZ45DRAFT_748341 [Acephala macrosclerotiorum]|nr:hypothetical protein BDZ45DRAFT_748341 [Acephala macrosclerotiorum]
MALRSVKSTLAQPQELDSDLAASSSTGNTTIQAAIAGAAPDVIDLTSPPPKKREARPVYTKERCLSGSRNTLGQCNDSENSSPFKVPRASNLAHSKQTPSYVVVRASKLQKH